MPTPTIVSVTSSTRTKVLVQFSQAMVMVDPTADGDALNPVNYAIDTLHVQDVVAVNSTTVQINTTLQQTPFSGGYSVSIEPINAIGGGATAFYLNFNSLSEGPNDPATVLSDMTVVDDHTLQLDFSVPLSIDGYLNDPSRYAISVRYGAARPTYVESIAPLSGPAPRGVLLTLRKPFTVDGKYAVSVGGIRDVYLRSINA